MLGQICCLGVGKGFVVVAFQVRNPGTGHDQRRHQQTYNDDGGQQSGFDVQLKCLHAFRLIISLICLTRQLGLLAKIVAPPYWPSIGADRRPLRRAEVARLA